MARGKGPVLTVVITSATEGLEKGLTEAQSKLGRFGAAAKGKAATIAKVAVPVAGAAAAVAKLGSVADKAKTDIASFNAALANSGVSAEQLAGPIADAVASAKDMAFSSAEARDALVSLQTATGDASKSAELLAVAQDVARLSGSDLTTAADAIAKAYNGVDRQLVALLPGLKKGQTGFETIANAQALAAGQADIFASSAEGLGIRTKAALKGIAVTIGSAVQPAFRALLEALLPLIESFGELLNAILPALVPLLNAAAKAFEIVAKAISKVVDIVTRLIGKIRELLAPLGEAVDKLKELNPFKGQVSNLINGNATATAAALTTGATPRAGVSGGGGVVINIYGDPSVIEAKVTKALRDYARRNGPAAVLTPGRA